MKTSFKLKSFKKCLILAHNINKANQQLDFMLLKLYNYFQRKCFPGLEFYLVKLVDPFNSLVDFGCGPTSPLRYVSHKKKSLGVDASAECVRLNKQEGIFTDYLVADILKTDLKSNSYDVAISMDVINLMKKKDGLALIKEQERIARKRVIVLCPNGFLEEPPEMKGESFSKYKSDYKYLKYRSSWTAKEMRRKGYTVIGLNGLKWLRKSNAKPRIKPTFLGVLISDLTQLITRFFPSLAFHLLCWKDKK